jgi:hypothetical protein
VPITAKASSGDRHLAALGMTLWEPCHSERSAQPCHSEERSDEESASEGEEKQMLRCAQHDRTLGTFMFIWWAEGPCNTRNDSWGDFHPYFRRSHSPGAESYRGQSQNPTEIHAPAPVPTRRLFPDSPVHEPARGCRASGAGPSRRVPGTLSVGRAFPIPCAPWSRSL